MTKELFLNYLSAERNYSPATVIEYNQALSAFANYVTRGTKEPDWCLVTEGDVRDWIVDMMEKGYKSTTVCARLSAMHSFYKYLLSCDSVQTDPTHRLTGPKKGKPLPYFIKEREMDSLLDGLKFPDSYEGKRDYTILLTFYSTGIRLAELIGLKIADVDLNQMTLVVTGKRNKQRIVPFGDEMKSSLTDYLAIRHDTFPETVGEELFLTSSGEMMCPSGVRNMVKNYLGMVTTIQKRSPHVLRHSFATAMLNHGAEIQVVKELLGHESLSTTEIYTHLTFEELKKSYSQAHPRG